MLTTITTYVSSQNKYTSLNLKTIDTISNHIAKVCANYGARKNVTKKELKRDKRQIAFLNKFFNNDMSADDIILMTNHFGCKACSFEIIDLGGFVKYERRIPIESYLDVYISFALLQNHVVYKRLYFKTKYSTDCLNPYEWMLSSQDIKYLRNYILPVANFPIIFSDFDYYIMSDTVHLDKLNSLSDSVYKFFVSPQDKKVNVSTWYSVDTYAIKGVELIFQYLVKDINTAVLKKLLYSPNQIMAINAMEALTYLADNLKVQLADEEKRKIEYIKNSDIKIKWLSGDVGGSDIAYKDLKITTSMITGKYSRIK